MQILFVLNHKRFLSVDAEDEAVDEELRVLRVGMVIWIEQSSVMIGITIMEMAVAVPVN